MKLKKLVASMLCAIVVLPLAANALEESDAFPGYGAAARAQLKTRKGCGYEEWRVTATKTLGQAEGPFLRGDEYLAKEAPCDTLPAKTTAPGQLVAALKKANTPMPRDARIVQVGAIEASVKDDDKRVSYRQATLRIFSKEMELSLGRCEDLDKNVLCGAMITVGKCSVSGPRASFEDWACFAWAVDEQAHFLDRASLRQQGGQAAECKELASLVAADARTAAEGLERARKNLAWQKSLKFKTMKGEVLDQEALLARFNLAAQTAEQVCH